MWRVWLTGLATLVEIETQWSLCDLADANEALDVKEELEQEAHKRSQARGK